MMDSKVVDGIEEWNRQDAKFAERKRRGKRRFFKLFLFSFSLCPLGELGVLAVPFRVHSSGETHHPAIHHEPFSIDQRSGRPGPSGPQR
jgi:hypothetical protein